MTKIEERKDIIASIKKSAVISGLVNRLLTLELEEARGRYEDISPASEFYRGQISVLKSLLVKLGAK